MPRLAAGTASPLRADACVSGERRLRIAALCTLQFFGIFLEGRTNLRKTSMFLGVKPFSRQWTVLTRLFTVSDVLLLNTLKVT